MSLFKGLILEGLHVHREGHFNHYFFLFIFFLILIVATNHKAIVVVHGNTHVVSSGVHVKVRFGVVYESLLKIFSMHFLIDGVSGNLVDLVSFSRIKGFNEFGGFYSSALAALEVVDVFVLHVEVEGRVAQVLFGAETFVSWKIFVVFRLGSSASFDVLFLVGLRLAFLNKLLFYF